MLNSLMTTTVHIYQVKVRLIPCFFGLAGDVWSNGLSSWSVLYVLAQQTLLTCLLGRDIINFKSVHYVNLYFCII